MQDSPSHCGIADHEKDQKEENDAEVKQDEGRIERKAEQIKVGVKDNTEQDLLKNEEKTYNEDDRAHVQDCAERGCGFVFEPCQSGGRVKGKTANDQKKKKGREENISRRTRQVRKRNEACC